MSSVVLIRIEVNIWKYSPTDEREMTGREKHEKLMNRCEIEVGEYVGIAVDKVWNENI